MRIPKHLQFSRREPSSLNRLLRQLPSLHLSLSTKGCGPGLHRRSKIVSRVIAQFFVPAASCPSRSRPRRGIGTLEAPGRRLRASVNRDRATTDTSPSDGGLLQIIKGAKIRRSQKCAHVAASACPGAQGIRIRPSAASPTAPSLVGVPKPPEVGIRSSGRALSRQARLRPAPTTRAVSSAGLGRSRRSASDPLVLTRSRVAGPATSDGQRGGDPCRKSMPHGSMAGDAGRRCAGKARNNADPSR
jgi:hypothetical protein